jgi:hypothetical protein
MRLVVGCTLKAQDLDAIQQGAELRDTVDAALLAEPLGTAMTANGCAGCRRRGSRGRRNA